MVTLHSSVKLNEMFLVRLPQKTDAILKMGEYRKIKKQTDPVYKGLCGGTGGFLIWAVAQSILHQP